MNTSRIKNKIKQTFYSPQKSKILHRGNLKIITELESVLDGSYKKKDDSKKDGGKPPDA